MIIDRECPQICIFTGGNVGTHSNNTLNNVGTWLQDCNTPLVWTNLNRLLCHVADSTAGSNHNRDTHMDTSLPNIEEQKSYCRFATGVHHVAVKTGSYPVFAVWALQVKNLQAVDFESGKDVVQNTHVAPRNNMRRPGKSSKVPVAC